MKTDRLDDEYQVQVSRLDAGEWDAAVAGFDDLSIYQTLPYALCRWPRSNVSHMILRREREIVSAAQVRLIEIPLLGGIAYLRWGPLWRRRGRGEDLEVLRRMVRAIKAEYVDRRGLMVELVPREVEARADLRQVFLDEGFLHKASDYDTLVIDLSPPLEKLRAGLDPRWRTELNRAQRGALVLSDGDLPELFDSFAPIYAEMFDRKGLVDLGDLPVYREIQRQLRPELRMRVMLCSEDGKAPVAGAITSALGDTGLGILWATSPRGRDLKGAYFLQWHVIDWLKRQGCRSYDLGGVSRVDNPGGFRFKSGLTGKNGREERFAGSFEASGSPLLPIILDSALALRRALRRFRGTLKSIGATRPSPGSTGSQGASGG